jgi:hypothetical protein
MYHHSKAIDLWIKGGRKYEVNDVNDAMNSMFNQVKETKIGEKLTCQFR